MVSSIAGVLITVLSRGAAGKTVYCCYRLTPGTRYQVPVSGTRYALRTRYCCCGIGE